MAKLLLIAALLAALWYFFLRRPSPTRMSVEDARRLLDVPPDASLDQIRAAHHRLMARVHPDSGGSAELAARVNLARDTLVGQITRTN